MNSTQTCFESNLTSSPANVKTVLERFHDPKGYALPIDDNRYGGGNITNHHNTPEAID